MGQRQTRLALARPQQMRLAQRRPHPCLPRLALARPHPCLPMGQRQARLALARPHPCLHPPTIIW